MEIADDTTIAECVDKKEDSHIQSDVEELIAKSNQNKFQLNESKCKELRISFPKSAADFAPIVINGKAIEAVPTVKSASMIRPGRGGTSHLTDFDETWPV